MLENNINILENVVAIGGFPGVGKTTLVERFKNNGHIVSFEFDEGSLNSLLKDILEGYFIGKHDAYLLQICFLYNTIDRYTTAIDKSQNSNKLAIIDRTILEDKFFAIGQIKDKKLLSLYKKTYDSEVNKIKKVGYPKVYVHLTVSLDEAKVRWKSRDINEYEEKIKNFENFKKMYSLYSDTFKNLIEENGIKYIEIDTSTITRTEVWNICVEKLKEHNIYV